MTTLTMCVCVWGGAYDHPDGVEKEACGHPDDVEKEACDHPDDVCVCVCVCVGGGVMTTLPMRRWV